MDYVVHADIYVESDNREFCAQNAVVRSTDQPAVLKVVLDRQGPNCRN